MNGGIVELLIPTLNKIIRNVGEDFFPKKASHEVTKVFLGKKKNMRRLF